MIQPRYSRVLMKLSGEVLAGPQRHGLDPDAVGRVCRELARVVELGVQVGVVVGGGNILRGAQGGALALDRTRGDRMGMLATLINALALEDRLEQMGVAARTLSATPMVPMAEPFTAQRARALLDEGVVTLFGGGTGHPYFSTDTAAALRALEIRAELLMKGTKVDGVYDRDPARFSDARRLEQVTHQEAIEQALGVLDLTALSLCKDHALPIVVFRLLDEDTGRRLVLGEREPGSFVTTPESGSEAHGS